MTSTTLNAATAATSPKRGRKKAASISTSTASAAKPASKRRAARPLKRDDASVATATARPQLTRKQIDELEKAFDAIRNEVLADLGERDAAHIRKMVRRARNSAIAGRSALMFGLDPFTWLFGVAALAHAKILENMEIGHNVMHGQYDWMNDPTLDSRTYDWDNVCAAENWKHYHNYEHHTYTNVIGKDRDFGYTLLRLTDEQEWKFYHAWQPINNALLAFLFQWGVGVHDQQLDQLVDGKQSWAETRRRLQPFFRKARKQLFKDYVLFPALALWNAPRVALGNLAANGIRNLWSYAIIFCGHFTKNVSIYTPEQVENETRGDWYVRQLLGSSNLEGSKAFYLLTGHLSHQIEHHMYPDLPACRYPEIKEKVQAICAQYGLPYNTGSFSKQFGEVMARVFKYTLPPSGTPAGRAASAAA